MGYMKIQNGIILFLALLAITITGCSSSKNNMTDFERDKREMQTEIQNAIKQIDNTLDTARVKADTLSQEASRTYDSTLQDLKQDKAKLQKRLSDLNQVAQGQWQKFKSEASSDINKAYNKIKDLDSNQTKKTD